MNIEQREAYDNTAYVVDLDIRNKMNLTRSKIELLSKELVKIIRSKTLPSPMQTSFDFNRINYSCGKEEYKTKGLKQSDGEMIH